MWVKGLMILIVVVAVVFIFSMRNKTVVSPKADGILPTILPSSPFPSFFSPVKPSVPIQQHNDMDDFVYPGSSVESRSQNSVSLISTDNATTITNWYRDKIIQMNLNTQSFVQQNTNGKISNQLISSNEEKEIQVEIRKTASDQQVRITVTFNAGSY